MSISGPTLFDQQSEAIQNAANIQAEAISQAAQISMQMMRESIAFQTEQNDIARSVVQPFVTAGKQSTGRLLDLLGVGGFNQEQYLTDKSAYDTKFNDAAKAQFQERVNQADIQSLSYSDRLQAQSLLDSEKFDPTKANEWLAKFGKDPLNQQSITDQIGTAPVKSDETAAQAQQRAIGEVMNDPAFKAQVDYGIGILDRSSAAQGMTKSGRLAQALQDYGQRQAYQHVQTNIQNLQNLQGQGLAAATNSASLANSLGVNVGNTLNQQGQIQSDYMLGLGQLGAATQLAQSPAAELAFNISRLNGDAAGVSQAGGLGAFGFMGAQQGRSGGFF